MCSRYELSGPHSAIASRFGLQVPPPWPNRAEIRPTDQALVVGPNGKNTLMPWGLPVDWDSRPLINARAETLSTRPTFRPLLERRILVPASSWWEWQTDGGSKTKMRLGLADGDLFAFAGLTDGQRFTIVTCPAAAGIAHVHDRMPVVLPRQSAAEWLDRGRTFADVAPLLMPSRSPLTVQPDASPTIRSAQGDLFG